MPPPSPFRESISWIISPFKFWTATIFLHAHLQVVYYKCVKFHKNPISCLGGVVLTRYMDRWTDRVIPIYPPPPPNFVCRGYKNLIFFIDLKETHKDEHFANKMHSNWMNAKILEFGPCGGLFKFRSCKIEEICRHIIASSYHNQSKEKIRWNSIYLQNMQNFIIFDPF